MDKYTVKMFPQTYRDIDKIYGQALLVSNYADNAIALAEKLEKAILVWKNSHIEGQKENMDFMLLKDIGS